MSGVATSELESPQEANRLAGLRRYAFLDREADPAFDRIVALAQDLFDLPISLMCIIEKEKQWFKARIGLDVSEMPRAWGFCDHTIAQEGPMVVPDSLLDPRFVNSPLVVGPPHIRFYAGAQIRSPDGMALGTLCVISDTPRADFSERDRNRLVQLAAMAAGELEMRRQMLRAQRQSDKKDVLIREGHLHVANSLQMIADVLQMQMQFTRDPGVVQSLRGAVNRIIAVGEVHQQLRRQQADEHADAADYIGRLLRRLWQAVAPTERQNDLEFVATDPIMLPIEMLVRLGFITAELTVNAIQHGAGRVKVTLAATTGGVMLTVEDQGTGLSERWQRQLPREAVGLRLVRMLAGEISLDPDRPGRCSVFLRA